MHLRGQDHLLEALLAEQIERHRQQRRPHAMSPAILTHRHATQTAVIEESRTSDRRAAEIDRQQMDGVFVLMVPLQRFRHVLFLDEHLAPEIGQRYPVRMPVRDNEGIGQHIVSPAGCVHHVALSIRTGIPDMQNYLPVVARLLLAQIFLLATVFQISTITSHPDGYTAYQMYLGQFGLPGIFAPLTLLVQLVAGILLFLGFKTRAAAYTLSAYALFIAVSMKLGDPISFMQYLAIAGGMLALASLAPTACSLDNLKKK